MGQLHLIKILRCFVGNKINETRPEKYFPNASTIETKY